MPRLRSSRPSRPSSRSWLAPSPVHPFFPLTLPTSPVSLLQQAAQKKKDSPFNRPAVEDVLARRFFVRPSFDIYGGVAGLYDLGPPGCAVQANILQQWRNHFILEEQMLEVDCTIMTKHDVFK